MNLKDNEKRLWHIILRWLIYYMILYAAYTLALNISAPDVFTRITAVMVEKLYGLFGLPAHWEIINPRETGIFIGENWAAKIVEGCNGMSIIILFISFVWAFPASWRDKILFGLGGSLLIWLVNIGRIALLGWIYYRRPAYFDIIHRVFFPGIMYGTVIVLWIVWASRVRNFTHSIKN
ncbi:MAG: exosortase family protein XrtF [Chlorobi bacterium]|nr:exosortase family protein XrtF [Chlorobiota bacterium]